MKKIITAALAVLMAAAATTTAFAADINQDSDPKNTDTAVNFSVAPTYTVTIPETVELGKIETEETVTYEKDLTITASAGVRLLEGQKIQVTMASDFYLDTKDVDAVYKLPYTVRAGEKDITIDDNVVATFNTSKDEQSSVLHFAANDPEYAGDYSDTVTFTVEVV